MTTVNSDSSEDTSKSMVDGAENAPGNEAGPNTPITYSPEMNQEIMRQLAQVNAMILAKVGSLSPEQQAQFHALIEQSKLVEAKGHLDS